MSGSSGVRPQPPAPVLAVGLSAYHGSLGERATFLRVAPLLVGVCAALVYANALANGFVLDDHGVIRDNPLVTSLHGTWRAFAHPYWPEALGGFQYRPLAIAGFSLDWAVSAGHPAWFHAVNLLWHVG
ncbi:MAG: hypothetical protein ACREON_17005, partial [Gemmatimonadaceae bacterium]